MSASELTVVEIPDRDDPERSVGVLLWRSGADFDFRVLNDPHLSSQPVPLDALLAELLLPGECQCERPH